MYCQDLECKTVCWRQSYDSQPISMSIITWILLFMSKRGESLESLFILVVLSDYVQNQPSQSTILLTCLPIFFVFVWLPLLIFFPISVRDRFQYVKLGTVINFHGPVKYEQVDVVTSMNVNDWTYPLVDRFVWLFQMVQWSLLLYHSGESSPRSHSCSWSCACLNSW